MKDSARLAETMVQRCRPRFCVRDGLSPEGVLHPTAGRLLAHSLARFFSVGLSRESVVNDRSAATQILHVTFPST